jgi:hypothetical protein
MIRATIPLLILCVVVSSASRAGSIAQIGDIDGFGYGAAPGFFAANGGPANAHGDPVLSNKDFLPDINRDGAVATGRGDDFDLRSASEINNTGNFFGAGVTNTAGTTGSKFTDISLSTSYDSSATANKVLIGGNPNTGLTFGAGGPFPSPPSNVLPNQPGFVFSFDINKANLATQTPIFFNMVFGDYDVTPAVIDITRVDGTTGTLSVMTQPNGQDGLIQAATTTLAFNDVFADGGSVWHASLKVDFVAPNEPYTAFDYVELSTVALVSVPEPATRLMMSIGLGAVVLVATWQRSKRRDTAPRGERISRAWGQP